MTWSGLAARVRWGPVLMLLAALAFTTMVACVKVARAELSTVAEVLRDGDDGGGMRPEASCSETYGRQW